MVTIIIQTQHTPFHEMSDNEKQNINKNLCTQSTIHSNCVGQRLNDLLNSRYLPQVNTQNWTWNKPQLCTQSHTRISQQASLCMQRNQKNVTSQQAYVQFFSSFKHPTPVTRNHPSKKEVVCSCAVSQVLKMVGLQPLVQWLLVMKTMYFVMSVSLSGISSWANVLWSPAVKLLVEQLALELVCCGPPHFDPGKVHQSLPLMSCHLKVAADVRSLV